MHHDGALVGGLGEPLGAGEHGHPYLAAARPGRHDHHLAFGEDVGGRRRDQLADAPTHALGDRHLARPLLHGSLARVKRRGRRRSRRRHQKKPQVGAAPDGAELPWTPAGA